MPEAKFQLRILDKTIGATVRLPEEPIRPLDLLPVLQGIGDAIVSAAVAGGEPVTCKAGCGACCRQMVPISETEALYLADLIEAMPEERRIRVLARFDTILTAMEQFGLMKRLGQIAIDDSAERLRIGLDYFQLGLACPFLEEENCSIHPSRPLSCREYLVTSPAVHCAVPNGETVRMVPVPAKLSVALLRFGDAKGEAPAMVIPLPLLLDYASKNPAGEQPRLAGPELFGNFFRTLLG